MAALKEIALASPLPTAAPHPRDVYQKLAPRQGAIETCGFVNGIFSSDIICPEFSICAQNTAVNALFCCNSALFPYCGVGPTSCVDSTDMAVSCTGICPFDQNVVKCTSGVGSYCALTKYDISTLRQTITGFGCNSVPGSLTAYDYYSTGGGVNHAAATASQVNGLSAAASASATIGGFGGSGVNPTIGGGGGGSGSGSGSSSGSGSGSGSGTNTSSSSSSGLSTGAIVGIAIGGIAGIAIIIALIALLCLQRRRHRRQQKHAVPNNVTPNPMIQQAPPFNPAAAAAAAPVPPPMNHHESMMSMSASQTSSTPLTQANVAAMSQPSQHPSQQSEVSPNESASQIGVYPGTASVLSHTSPPPPTYHTADLGSNTAASQQDQQSSLGPLPGPYYPTGAAAFPHHGGGGNPASSVMSPGSAFGSLPPGHAPSVTSHQHQ